MPRARPKTSATLGPPPLSLTRRWDKAKWHVEGKPPTTVAKGSRHILAALRFLSSRGQLTKSGERELRDGASLELALLAEHVRPGARAFLDEAYGPYLAACDDDAASEIAVLDEAWRAYAARFDVRAKPRPTPYQALLVAHTGAGDPELEDLLQTAADQREVCAALAEAAAHAPRTDAPRIRAFLAVANGLAAGARGLERAKLGNGALLDALGYFSDPAVLPIAARAFARLGPRAARRPALRALARVVSRQKRAAWLRLDARTRTPLRAGIHALLPHDSHLALLALCVAADRSSVALVDAAGTFPDEGIEETYRFTGGRAVVARRARSYDPLRRAIAKVARGA